MFLSRAGRLALGAAATVAMAPLVTTVPAAHASTAVVFSRTGVALDVGDIVAQGTYAGDDLCAFHAADYLVKGNAVAVRTAVTEQCTLVIEAIEQAGDRAGLPTGPATPKQPSDSSGALPSLDPAETAGSLPHPDRYAHRLARIENSVFDEARRTVFSAVDEFTFTRNLTTGDLGPPTYRIDGSYCSGAPYVRAGSPVTATFELPFRNTVTECTYEFVSHDSDSIELNGVSGYRQAAPSAAALVVERARFTVMNVLTVDRDRDLNIYDDYSYLCPVIDGRLPVGWELKCDAAEVDANSPL